MLKLAVRFLIYSIGCVRGSVFTHYRLYYLNYCFVQFMKHSCYDGRHIFSFWVLSRLGKIYYTNLETRQCDTYYRYNMSVLLSDGHVCNNDMRMFTYLVILQRYFEYVLRCSIISISYVLATIMFNVFFTFCKNYIIYFPYCSV